MQSLLSPEWQRWVQDNLARGCDSTTMLVQMVKGGIDARIAGPALAQAMAERTNGSAAPATPQGPYQYTGRRFRAQGNFVPTHDKLVRISAAVDQPVVVVLDDVLSHAECDELVRLSRAKLHRSTIVDPATGKERVIEDRKSSGTFFTINENPFIAQLDRRISDIMQNPVEFGEGLQILNYQVGGEYKSHFDYFPPLDPGSAVHLAKGGQRISTLVIYLNDVEAGGETEFPRVNFRVTPKKGSAVYFEYFNELGQVDEKSLHGGLPVQAGEKWIATKWMRQSTYL